MDQLRYQPSLGPSVVRLSSGHAPRLSRPVAAAHARPSRPPTPHTLRWGPWLFPSPLQKCRHFLGEDRQDLPSVLGPLVLRASDRFGCPRFPMPSKML